MMGKRKSIVYTHILSLTTFGSDEKCGVVAQKEVIYYNIIIDIVLCLSESKNQKTVLHKFVSFK